MEGLDMYIEASGYKNPVGNPNDETGKLKNQVFYTDKIYMVLYRCEPTDRLAFNEVFIINTPSPLSTEEKEEDDDNDGDDKDLWSLEEERRGGRDEKEKQSKILKYVESSTQLKSWTLNGQEVFNMKPASPFSSDDDDDEEEEEEEDDDDDDDGGEGRRGIGGKKEEHYESLKSMKFSSQSKGWTLKACRSNGQEEPVTKQWYSSETPYQEYLQMSKVYGQTITEFCNLNICMSRNNEHTADEVYEIFKGEDCVRDLPKSEAIKLFNLAIWLDRHLNWDYHCYRCVAKLLSLVPCITIKTNVSSEHFGKSCISLGIFNCGGYGYIYRVDQYLQQLFVAIEPVFHPLIRKKNIKDVVWLSRRDYRIESRKSIQFRKEYLVRQPWAENGIKLLHKEASSEAHLDAMKIVELHQHFDLHLAFCSTLNEKSKIKDVMADDNVVPARFKILDDSLIKASLRLRIRLLKRISEYKRYVAWFTPFLDHNAKYEPNILGHVLKAVREVHTKFPEQPEEYILDEKHGELSSFCYLLSEMKRFLSCPVSDRYFVEGIMVYLEIDLIKTPEMRQKELNSWMSGCMKRLRLLKRVWGRRHYEHHAYATLFDNYPGDG